MDGQLKRGMLDVCVLAAIRKEDSYGYQILKDRGLCGPVGIDALPHPAAAGDGGGAHVRTAEHNGRLRKYYHLTPQGLARIEQFKTEWEQIVNIYQFILSTEGTEHDES